MKQRILGILSFSSITLLLLILLLVWLSGEHFRAANLQFALVLMVSSVAFTGMYLMRNYCPSTPKTRKYLISSLGGALIICGIIVSFNLVPFITSYNWLISLGILYILLVQLQLLNWGKESNILSKICAYILILANVSLFIFFIILPGFHAFTFWIDITVMTSVFSFLLGMVISNKSLPEKIKTAD